MMPAKGSKTTTSKEYHKHCKRNATFKYQHYGRLRYKSTSFRTYHRNVAALAALHAKAVTEAAINQYENINYISDDEDEKG